MAISTEEALSAYGYVYTLANNIPQLKTFLDQAIAGGWTADHLVATVESSPWWMQNADTVRNLAVSQAVEPGTYAQNVANAKNLVSLKAQQMGYTLTDERLTSLAYQSLVSNSGFNQDVLANLIVNTGGTWANTQQGEAAQLNTHMKELAASYGVPVSDDFIQSQMRGIQAQVNTIDGYEAVIRARAKAAFPQFSDQIDAGMTVRDIADPYISTYAQTLEVPETSVTLNDSYVQKALSQRQDGVAQSMPLWQFQRMLKDDPRYDKTQQAKDDAFTTLRKIGSDFGFVGSNA